MNIKDLQAQANELKKAQNWGVCSVEQRAMFLVTEMGEVVQEVLKLSGAYQNVDQEEARVQLGLEIYDAVWNLCDLAKMVGIDLEAAFEKKVEINRGRKW